MSSLRALLLVDAPAPVVPFVPCPREYAGNMCGVYITGLPAVPGGARNPELCLSWLYDRYDKPTRDRIRGVWKARHLRDVLLSWPDSRAFGQTPAQFQATCRELRADGFYILVMLGSKDHDPAHDVPALQQRIREVLPVLTREVHRMIHAWECSLFLTPDEVQQMIDWLAPQILPWGCKHYVHFEQGYSHDDYNGKDASFAGFWNRQVGKLHGIFHQRLQWPTKDGWSLEEYPARLVDILDRYAGGFGCVPDSGFGHPFDCIAGEITAMAAFHEGMSEAEQDQWARAAVTATPVRGPFGLVRVMGSGNGAA